MALGASLTWIGQHLLVADRNSECLMRKLQPCSVIAEAQ
jgi:hypothetical protein